MSNPEDIFQNAMISLGFTEWQTRPAGTIEEKFAALQWIGDAPNNAPTLEQVSKKAASLSDPVPEFARSGDFFHALIDLGWYDQIDAVINGMVAANHPDARLAKVLWDKASRFERHHPLLIQIAQAIGKTSDDLDNLFRKTLEYA